MEFLPLARDTLKSAKRKKLISLSSEIEEEPENCQNVTEGKKIKKNIKNKSIPVTKQKKFLTSKKKSASDEGTLGTEKYSTPGKNKKVEIPRLFVNMKKKILNESDVKELHPDIVSIRFPRKKCSRWCWAVFETQEKADRALNELKTRKDIIVTKPLTGEKRESKRKKKLDEVKMRKLMKKKLKASWL